MTPDDIRKHVRVEPISATISDDTIQFEVFVMVKGVKRFVIRACSGAAYAAHETLPPAKLEAAIGALAAMLGALDVKPSDVGKSAAPKKKPSSKKVSGSTVKKAKPAKKAKSKK